MKEGKTKMGRPPKRKADKQASRIQVNLTPAEFRQVTREAKAAKLSRSAYLVECWRKARKEA